MKTCLLMAGAVALACSSAAIGQRAGSAQAPAGFAPMQSPCAVQGDGTCVAVSTAAPLPTAAKQETVQLVAGNVAAAPVAVYGGSYVLVQSCTGYGTLSVRFLGPDGLTMMPLTSKTAADSGGGSLLSLGANAVVDATVSGTTGCNALLSRIP